MTFPFDRTLPSPIASVIQLRASSESSVVEGDRTLTGIQQRMRVPTGLDEAIVSVADTRRPGLILISGSAGGGKSLIINRLATEFRDHFSDIVEDATHSDAPNEEQSQRLVARFGPLADRQPPYEGKPLLIAMNTGMVIRFFDQLRRAHGADHGFINLEAAIKSRLGLVMQAVPRDPKDPSGAVIVVNLDYRPTAGPAGSLFEAMLRAVAPEASGSVFDSRRCETCQVSAFCFVRSNAFLISSPSVRSVLNGAVDRLALERGRPLQPRALWDLIADLLTGGDPFGEPDPCDRIAELSTVADGAITVWRRLAFNGPFTAVEQAEVRTSSRGQPTATAQPPSHLGPTGRSLATLDVSFNPGREMHALLAESGIDPERDSARLVDALREQLPEANAIPTAAAGLRTGLVAGTVSGVDAGRGIIRALWLFGQLTEPATEDRFRAALNELLGTPGQALEELRLEVGKALALAFGSSTAGRTFFRTEAYDSHRDWAIDVEVDLEQSEEYLSMPVDKVSEINPEGAQLVGYTPLVLTFRLPKGAELVVDMPLYRLLSMTAAGTLPSSADLQRFFHLRRAAEILGQHAARDTHRNLLLENRDEGRKYLIYRRRDALIARPVA